MLDPAVDGGVVNGEASLSHHLFQVRVAQGVVPEIPAQAKQDDLRLDNGGT